MSAPTDLEDLGHGRGSLRAAPAASVRRLDALLGRPLDINRAYADYHQQMAYYLAYRRYLAGGPWAPLALHPDKSWHCKGMALDTDDRLAAFREHGWRFEVKEEPWHGQYYPHLDTHYGEPAGGNAKPLPDPPKDQEYPDMFLAVFDIAVGGISAGSVFLIVPNGAGKPQGVVLDGQSLKDKPDLPIIHFAEKFSAESAVRAITF